MAKRDLPLVGIWRLISFQAEYDDGIVTYPFGGDVAGLLIIDAKGYFSAQVMDMKRPSFRSADPCVGTLKEVKTTLRIT